ncbi:MAG: protein kinase, partial [Planctomycetota bacterium]
MNSEDADRKKSTADQDNPEHDKTFEQDLVSDPEAYLEQYPELAAEIKNLFHGISLLPGEGKRANPPLGETPPESSGYVIDDFRIIREIDSGGMGRVYEAEQISLRRRIALKVLFPHLSLSEKAVHMFQREAEAGSRLNHPGIVSVYAVGKHKGVHYIAQELVRHGVTLADRLNRFKEVNMLPRSYFKETAALIARVAEALSCMHASNVIHRDIKPTNILITQEGFPKISDFGLARLEDSLSLTRSHNFSGTPFYMSPEQSSTSLERLDHRTDIFSLGVTLYESLTLKRPFTGSSSREVQAKIQYLPSADPRKINKQVPSDLVLICAKAMEKDRERRYQSMKEFAEDLHRFIKGEPVLARPAGKIYSLSKWIQRHKLLAVTSGAVVIAAISIFILAFHMTRHRQQLDAFLEQQYIPCRLALGWEKLDVEGRPWKWIEDADPGSPGSYMLQALFLVDTGALNEAVSCLEQCMERCEARNEPALEQDAKYLLCVVKRQLAMMEEDPAGQNGKLEEAQALCRTLTPNDPSSPSTLIHRSFDNESDPLLNKSNYLHPIKLNVNHYLVSLYHGTYLFQSLYKGGERSEFEKAIDYFERVLVFRPHHVVASAFMGRVEFFFARSYHYFHLLDDAVSHLQDAVESSGNRPYHLVYSTLGQIACYRSEYDSAEHYFEQALRSNVGNDKNIHNAYAGLGNLRMLQGRLEEARKFYLKALDIMSDDSHSRSGLSEVLLKEMKEDEALLNANEAKKNKRANLLMRPYLASLQVHVKREEYAEMLDDLQH